MFIDSSNEMLTNEKLLIVSDVVNGLMRERGGGHAASISIQNELHADRF